MVKLTKIYTKSGDQGTTGLGTGARVSKHDLRVEAYGQVDELNSFLGHALIQVPQENQELRSQLLMIQNELFDLGADLCIPIDPENPIEHALRITEPSISRLESHIDEMNHSLTPLTSFILPGGTELASRIHIARAVSRRAERAVSELCDIETEQTSIYTLQYLNRLSDYLFVLARFVNLQSAGDILWVPGKDRNDKPQ